MKFGVIIVTVLLLLPFAGAAQEQPKARVIDESANDFCSEHMRGRMDTFLAELSNQPGSIGHIIGSADAKIPGRYLKYERALRQHVSLRNFDPSRVKIHRGPDGGDMRFVYWLVPQGANPPELPGPYAAIKIDKPTLFDESGIVSVKGGIAQFGEADDGAVEPCDWGLKLEDYADALKQDEELTAVLVGYSTRMGNAIVNKALRSTATELAERQGISPKRIRYAYGGLSKTNVMKIWLIPAGRNFPNIPRIQSSRIK